MALTDGLISWFDLEETSGSRADAHSSNDLNDINGVGVATGQVGNAADFVQANDERLTRPTESTFITTEFTVTFWVFLDSVGSFAPLVGFASRHWTVAGDLTFFVRDSTDSNWTTVDDVSPSTGQWYFVVAWYDDTEEEIGLRINDRTPVTGSHTGGLRTTDNGLRVGGNAQGFNSFHDGRVDSLGIWNRVLTATERDGLWNEGNGLAYSDLADEAVSVSVDLQGQPGTYSAGLAAIAALSATLEGQPGTLAATVDAIAKADADLQGQSGTFAADVATIAKLEAVLTGQPGTFDASLSTTDLTQIAADLQGQPGTFAAQAEVRAAFQAALEGQPGTLSIEAEQVRTLTAALEGRPGTLAAALEVTAAIEASLEGRPGHLSAIIGDPPRLASLAVRIEDALRLSAALEDAFTLNVTLED